MGKGDPLSLFFSKKTNNLKYVINKKRNKFQTVPCVIIKEMVELLGIFLFQIVTIPQVSMLYQSRQSKYAIL